MTCYYPIPAWRPPFASASKQLIFSYHPERCRSHVPDLHVPCGQCIGCRLARSVDWAVRCMHEAHLYDSNCFVTLTYAPEHLPDFPSLDHRDFQLFMKRLRKRFCSSSVNECDNVYNGIRFFMCGEYGDELSRPHYHACLFNFDFSDRELFTIRNGVRLYTSAALSDLWPYGFATVGDVTFESAAYVARYVTKKVTGAKFYEHYERYDTSTGEVRLLYPEYARMSLKPGIGSGWFDKYSTDVFPSDEVVLNGKHRPVPSYYDKLLKLSDEASFDKIKADRVAAMRTAEAKWNSTPERLRVREVVKLATIKSLNRSVEHGEC